MYQKHLKFLLYKFPVNVLTNLWYLTQMLKIFLVDSYILTNGADTHVFMEWGKRVDVSPDMP